jgi:hypothetical protein
MTEFASGEGEGPYDDEAGNVGYRRHREHLDVEHLDVERLRYLVHRSRIGESNQAARGSWSRWMP